MSKGINSVHLVGNVGNDPEQRSTGGGKAVVNWSLATTESWKDKATGEAKSETEWHRCVAFGRLAEIVAEYAHKGDRLYVEGKLKTDKYEKDGVDHYTTKVVVNEIVLLGGKPAGGPAARPAPSDDAARRAAAVQKAQKTAGSAALAVGFDDDDMVPFS